ncbi:uncharacterized protein LOC134187723 [Corticium candelabrum]|uniref:uncharacterized protein LOC134187723 n=1 Tax=Corticium candelabrum TaxID=121492 RepID=UPI002E253233|nr:uncharacterized protein LOC134187723 [Corticium candelabrum]
MDETADSVDSLSCYCGISTIKQLSDCVAASEDATAGLGVLEPTEMHQTCWDGYRMATFGEMGSGFESFCDKLIGKGQSESDQSAKRERSCSLCMNLRFDRDRDTPGVCLQLSGIGQCTDEANRLSTEDLLTMFPSWRLAPLLRNGSGHVQTVDPRDLSCLCNDLVRSVQDVDDAFAIRLGMLLCETVVLVHDGDCLYSLHQNVEELLLHLNSVAQIERQEEGQKSRGVVRCTRDVFVVVNFKNRSAASSEHKFHHFMDASRLRWTVRRGRGQKVTFRLYNETKVLSDPSYSVAIYYVAWFNDSAPSELERDIGISVISYIKDNITPQGYYTSLGTSPFSPLEKAASLLLPSFVCGNPSVTIRESRVRKLKRQQFYSFYSSQQLKRRLDVMIDRDPLPDHQDLGIL